MRNYNSKFIDIWKYVGEFLDKFGFPKNIEREDL